MNKIWGILLLPLVLHAAEFKVGENYSLKSKGNLGVEYWFFPQEEKSKGVTTLFGELDVSFDNRKNWELRLHPRALIDLENRDRSRVRPPLIDDLYFNYYTNAYEIRAGYQIVSWKTVESYSPADFLNQTDREEDLLDPEKLSELAIRARYVIHLNREYVFELFVIPRFRPTHLPVEGNKYFFEQIFGTQYKVSNDPDDHVYLNDLGEWMPQGAIRFQSTYFNFLDLSYFYFFGYDRFPGLRLGSGDQVVHEYRPAMKSGITYQGDLGNWLVKGEAVINIFPEQATNARFNPQGTLSNEPMDVDPYLAYNLGFEYTLYSLIQDDQDVGLITEFIGDTDWFKGDDEVESFRPFRSHVFAGLRYSWNSISDRSFLLGGMYNYRLFIEDQESELFYQAEYQERIMNNLMVKLRMADIVVTQDGGANMLKSFDDKMRFDVEALISF